MSTSRLCSSSSVYSRLLGGSLVFPLSLSGLTLLAGLLIVLTACPCLAQSGGGPEAEGTTVDQFLSSVYSLSHLIGQGAVRLIAAILPSMPAGDELVDPIGVTAVVTLFLAVAAIVKRAVWIVVIVGWVLVLVRLIMIIVDSHL